MSRRQVLSRFLPSVALGILPFIPDRNAAFVGTAYGPTKAEMNRITDLASSFMQRFDVPGLSVAVAREGKIIYAAAFGEADYRSHEKLTPEHRFRIASLTKGITSAAIFKLTETTHLSIHDTVFGTGSILGTEFGINPYNAYTKDITIEHLLTHTSGAWPNDANDPMMKLRDLGSRELISWTLDHNPLTSAPGQKWAYTNFGYCILGRVIEKKSGMEYRKFVQDEIFGCLPIKGITAAHNSPGERDPEEVTYYGQSGENPYSVNVYRMDANGGWLASATDLALFATAVDGYGKPRNILHKAAFEQMLTPVSGLPGQGNGLYAKGWHVDSKTPRIWFHDGSLPGTTTILKVTSERLCVAGLTNTRRQPSGILSDHLFKTVDAIVSQISG